MLRTFNWSRAVSGLLITAFAWQSSAHDTWLVPERFHRSESGAVTLSLTSGMEFPQLEHAIKRDRVAIAEARGESGRLVEVRVSGDAAKSLTLKAQAPRGVTAFWVVLQPRPSELKAEQVREYVDHLNVPDPAAMYEAWRKKGATALNYRYTKYAKTFVRAATSGGSRSWSDAVGLRLELVPENDPTRLTAGQTLRLVLFDEGKARWRHPVSVINGGATRMYMTDDDGRVTIDVRSAGQYLVRATTVEPSAIPTSEWDVHFTTLTFEAHEGGDAP